MIDPKVPGSIITDLEYIYSDLQEGDNDTAISNLEFVLSELGRIKESLENRKTVKVTYRGFESIIDLDEDWVDYVNEVAPEGEYRGSVVVTFEYIPSEDEK